MKTLIHPGSEIIFRPIAYGRPAAISPKAALVEIVPDWPETDPAETSVWRTETDIWEDAHFQLWAADRHSAKFAYGLLRAFRHHDSVTIDGLPEGLAIGQIPKGKTLIIKPK